MDRLDDPELMTLPHPVRVDAVTGVPADTRLFEEFGVLPRLKRYLTDRHSNSEWIINHVPGMYALAEAHFGMPGGLNMGSFLLTLVRARLRAHQDPILQVSPALQAMLAETDLAAGLPARYFRSPYTLAFVEFARPNGVQVYNRLSGLHDAEGAYIGVYDLPAHHDVFSRLARNAALNLDPARPVRAVEIVAIGSPLGKANALDDASQDLLLLIQDEDACLSTVLDRHIAWFNTPAAYGHPAMAIIEPTEAAMIKPIVYALAKVLLYLNLPEAEQVRVAEREALTRRLRSRGQLRTARSKRRLAAVYDRILIGPSTLPATDEPGEPVPGEPHRGLRPHWRRGHFRRIRFGEGLSESRLGWIQPYLVKAAEAFGAVKGGHSGPGD